MMNGYGMMGGFGMIFQLIFWAAGIYFIFVAIIKFNSKDDHKSLIEDNSLQILKERYAKGEISEEEYKKMKADLTD